MELATRSSTRTTSPASRPWPFPLQDTPGGCTGFPDLSRWSRPTRLAILDTALGRDLRPRALSDEEAWVEMTASMPREYAEALFSFSAGGTFDESQALPTVEEVTGRKPRRFAQWAATHAEAFR